MRLASSALVIGAAVVAVLLLLLTSDSDSAEQPETAFTLSEATANGSFTVVAVPGRYQGKTAEWWAKRAVQARRDANARKQVILRLRRQLAKAPVVPTVAIKVIFGQHADEALHVSWCESRWDPGASNGQYLGLFQMGSGERARYGHAPDPAIQARAAYNYFAASGFDWSPWDPRCRP